MQGQLKNRRALVGNAILVMRSLNVFYEKPE